MKTEDHIPPNAAYKCLHTAHIPEVQISKAQKDMNMQLLKFQIYSKFQNTVQYAVTHPTKGDESTILQFKL